MNLFVKIKNMKHYICTGECEGVSEKPGVCQAPNCSRHNQPLVECECQKEDHIKILEEEIAKNPEASQSQK
jgi:hypothetical protein